MVSIDDVADRMRVFGSRFIDEIKISGEILRRELRLVSQNYSDENADHIPTKAPTIPRFQSENC